MSEETIIEEKNLLDFLDQDLKAMEFYLTDSEDALLDTTPIPLKIEKKHEWIFCKCGNIVIESPANQFRCGNCGNIKYNKTEV